MWLPEHAIVAESAASAFPYGTDGKLRSGVEGDRPDPLELLAYLAAFSTNLRLGTGVLIAPLQSPVVLAKRAATVDVLSGGRLLLGLGVGWQREEYAAVGVPFEERGQRLEEAIPVLRTLWEKSPASYQGKTVRFERVYSLSGAIRRDHPDHHRWEQSGGHRPGGSVGRRVVPLRHRPG